MTNDQTGFTLIEILIVASVIVFITIIVLSSYRAGATEQALQRMVHKLAQDLRRAQDMAVSSKEFQGLPVPGGYGLYFQANTTSYILFADQNSSQSYDGETEMVETIQLERGVKITSLSSLIPLTVIFVPPDPLTIIKPQANWASVALNNGAAVKINKTGLIEIE